jgi:EAL domain-containing protein (putative c-di-GMP-specific phosphodiesterase class I)
MSIGVASLTVSVGLAGSWAIAYGVGGASKVAPHWFYLPVLYAAARFGRGGAALSGVAAGLIAGPLMPADVAAGLSQQPQDWIVRACFFVIIGQAMAVVIGQSRAVITSAVELAHLECELRSGLKRREFVLHYQPIINVTTGEIAGAEALVRWQHPACGLLDPDRFIDLSERTGLVVELGDQVLEMACSQLAAWRSGPLSDTKFFCLAVNVSACQLVDSRLVAHVAAAIAKYDLDPSWLQLEVTETALISDVAGAAERLSRLKELGVSLAIDDFGTGHASLAYLHQFPIDAIKIDRSFVASLGSGGRADAVSRAVVQLAHALPTNTVAEGVETVDQLRQLRALHCDLAQGFYFSRPLPPEQLSTLLEARAPFVAQVGAAEQTPIELSSNPIQRPVLLLESSTGVESPSRRQGSRASSRKFAGSR